jgi:hypothetical protein
MLPRYSILGLMCSVNARIESYGLDKLPYTTSTAVQVDTMPNSRFPASKWQNALSSNYDDEVALLILQYI